MIGFGYIGFLCELQKGYLSGEDASQIVRDYRVRDGEVQCVSVDRISLNAGPLSFSKCRLLEVKQKNTELT